MKQKRGKLIVIEGLDGSGKATQAKLLSERLCGQQISFPDYASDSSALVKMYLSGQFGAHPADVNAYAASSFYAVDRYASYKTKWGKEYKAGGLVIADRYTTSNAIHQCSKLPKDQWNGYLEWLFDFEYNRLGIPAPDMVIYLRVDPVFSQKLLEKRYHGDTRKKDIHESDLEYLERSRIAADYCAERLGWDIIECMNEGGMRSIQMIGEDIIMRIRNKCPELIHNDPKQY